MNRRISEGLLGRGARVMEGKKNENGGMVGDRSKTGSGEVAWWLYCAINGGQVSTDVGKRDWANTFLLDVGNKTRFFL